VFILDLYSFSILYYFLCIGFWPFLCSWETGVLCDYQMSSFRFILITCCISHASVLWGRMKLKSRVCVCVYYSLLLCVHLKLYLRHNQGKEECRQSVYLLMSWKSSFGTVTRLWSQWSGVWFQAEEIFIFSRASRLALRSTRPAIQWVAGLFPEGYSSWGMQLTTDLHLVSALYGYSQCAP
jgi:hypothetical protein